MSEEKPEGPADWRAANLRGNDLSGLDLKHADMRGADLRDVNFTRSDMSYADLRGAKVQGANFQYAKLYGAKMQGMEAFHTDFRNSDLRLSNFGGAYLDGAAMPPPVVAKDRLPTPSEIVKEQNSANGKQEKSLDRGRAQERGHVKDRG